MLIAGEKFRGKRASKNGAVVQTTKLDQNTKEDGLLKFSKEHHWVFCIGMSYILLPTSPNFGRIFK